MVARYELAGSGFEARHHAVRYRRRPRESDRSDVDRLTVATGVFSAAERRIATELINERLTYGHRSGYYFLFAMLDDELIGYTAYGPAPATIGSYDLYWIAVHPGRQGQGLGTELLARTERLMIERGARRVYVETSSRAEYSAARRFYERSGYRECARLGAYYAPADDKIIFARTLRP